MARLTNDLAAESRAAQVVRDPPVAMQGRTQADLETAARAGDANETIWLQKRRGETPAERAAAEVRMGVYAIRNTVDGAVYVGSAPDLDIRWAQHRTALSRACHHNDQLQTAWVRYGSAAFEFIILERVENSDSLAHAEQGWIDRYAAEDLHRVYNGQSRVIRKLRKLLSLDETAQRLGLRPVLLRRWVNKGLVSYHQASPNGSRRIEPEQIGFDPEEIGSARERIHELEGHRVAEIVAGLRVHQKRVRRWLRRGRFLRHRLGAPDAAEDPTHGGVV